MPARSSSSIVSLRCTALALAASTVLAACSRQSAPAAAATGAASDAAATVAMQPAPTAAALQAPAPRVARAPADAGTSSYVNESTDPNAPVYADDPNHANDDQQQVVSVYVDPPLEEPAPIAVDWAPPPMLVEEVSPQPYPDAIWTGGYWAWQGRWVWSAGRWARPPRPDYRWHQPYYEHRADKVVYVPAYWSPPDRHFIAPATGIAIMAAVVAAGVHAGHHAEGPQGVFIPPPPGSRPGLIVPAPVGTPPSVVIGAPPVVKPGMRVDGNVENDSRNVTNNVTNTTQVRNVIVVAPAGTTANGRAFQQAVAADPHRPPEHTVRPTAPMPRSTTPVAAWQPGRPVPALPAAQPVLAGPPRAERAERAQIQQLTPDNQRAAPEPSQQQAQRVQEEQQQRAQQAQQRAQQDQQRAQQEQAARVNEARAQAERARADAQRRAPEPKPEDAERK